MSDIMNPESYVVPEVITEPQEVQSRARNLRVGDALNEGKNAGAKVAEVKVGTKRVTAWDESGKEIAYLLLDDGIVVLRARETEASQEARETVKGRFNW